MAAKSQGMSTSKKVIAGAAVGVALPAAVGTAKKLMGGSDEGDARRQTRPARRSSSTRSAAKSRSTSKTRSSSKSRAKASSSSSSPTREQLYRTATRLKIEGRSRMTKAQLQRAVTRARSRA